MSNILPDGTVVPSYFNVGHKGSNEKNKNQHNTALRMGEVRKIVYPDDVLSISKRYVEYSVSVFHRDGDSPTTSSIYNGCTVSNLFGGFADELTYTLRNDNQTVNGIGVGSKVLLMCINGQTSDAFIVGGIRDVNTGYENDKDHRNEGHNLFFEFNGIQFAINNDGEMKLTFRGATKTDSTLRDDAVASAEGSYIQIDRQGSIKIATPSEDQFITVDHQNRRIEIQAQSQWNTVVHGETNLTADGLVNIRSAGVHVGDATNRWMLGDVYRTAESTLNNTLSGQATALASLMATAGSALTTATPLNAIPVIGGVLAAAPLAIAASALTAAAPIHAAISAATSAFEAAAPSYLSPKNLND